MEPLLAIKKIFFTSTAIYLSENFVDIAEAKLTFGGMRISSLQRLPISKYGADQTYSDISGEVDKLFAKLFPEESDRPVRIAVNVRNKHLILRRFTIRDISRNEINQAVAFEAQRYIPSLIDNLTYGFKTYSRKPGLREIVFAAAETKNIHEMTDWFEKMNILPSTIEPVPILLARSLDLKKDLQANCAYIFIHYEPADKVILCEISNRYPYFFRELTIAGENEEGAEKSDSPELNYPTLKSVWPRIEREVIGGIDYLRKETNEKVEKIFISGFAPSPDETGLSQEFGIPFDRPDLSFFKGIESDRDRYLPALMLLYDSQRKPLLNIAPQEIIRNDPWALKSVAVKSLLALCVILLIHSFLAGVNAKKAAMVEKAKRGFDKYADMSPSAVRESAARPKSAIGGRAAPAANTVDKYAAISRDATREDAVRYKNAIIEKAMFVNKLVRTKYYLTEKLSQLEATLPPECWIEYLDYTNKAGGPDSLSFTIRGFVFGGINSSNITKIFESIKQDAKLMRGFKKAELVYFEKKEMFKREITKFEIAIR